MSALRVERLDGSDLESGSDMFLATKRASPLFACLVFIEV
ncbi:hypothetical protein BLJAPNOD_05446 [Ensifer sp. M14]|nr:hypothetical protein BLJAPNOD_05446 [Ensifer sp. M14]CAD6438320.1 hypothetical protein REQ54_04574 [Rhizobium sp. Q54]